MKNNKVCIVTGASRGLGRGIALVLAQEEGCTVYATARNEEALKALAEEAAAGTKGGVVKVCTLDQSDDAAVQDFVEQVKSEENQVDMLVNSAFAGLIAITPHFGKPFWERPLSVFDASLNIGLRSAHVMSALVAPLMVKNKATNENQARMSGKVLQTAELAVDYGFTDVNGGMPEGDFSGVEAAKRCREVMSKPLIQYDMDAELPDPSETNNPGIAGLFAGAQNYSEK